MCNIMEKIYTNLVPCFIETTSSFKHAFFSTFHPFFAWSSSCIFTFAFPRRKGMHEKVYPSIQFYLTPISLGLIRVYIYTFTFTKRKRMHAETTIFYKCHRSFAHPNTCVHTFTFTRRNEMHEKYIQIYHPYKV
jgi:H+/gluconate symporter-like permease